MKIYLFLFVSLIAYKSTLAGVVPASKNNDHLPPNANTKVEEEIDNLGLEYGRYLQEVVMTLEQDKHFSEKLQNVSSEDIKSGKIAGELDFVHHNVRTKLDELKRIELDRLRKLIKQENELNERGTYQSGRKWHSVGDRADGSHISKYEHVDHKSQHQFTKDDLHKLIIKASNDLEELDKKRREEFKQYEMEKEFQYQESLKNLTAEQKAEAVKKHDEQIKKHKEHPRVHHPGSKQQFEEVWEQQDHMPKEEFNPKTFFALHDLNGDGVLDQEEVESLLSTEIKKLYDPNNPEDDPNEMQEEYHRMREQIYREADKDHDGLISRKEFLDLTAKPEFEKDEGWKTLDEQQVYSQDELREYEKHRQEALAHQYAYYVQQQQQYYHPGAYYDPYGQQHPSAGVAYVPVQQHPGVPMQAGHPQQGGIPMQPHPNAIPQQHPGAIPQVAHQGVPMQGGHPQQAGIPMQPHPNAIPQQHPGVAQQGVPPQVGYQQPPQQLNPAYNTQQQAAALPQASGNIPQQQNPQQGAPPPVGYQQPQFAQPNMQQHPNIPQQQQPNVPQYSAGQANPTYQQAPPQQQQLNSQPKH